jgi:hypothetical protein
MLNLFKYMIFLYIFFIEMVNPPNPMDDFMHRLSVDIFGEDVVDNTKPSQYYQQPQSNAPYYPRHVNLPFTLDQIIYREILTINLNKPLYLLHYIILITPQVPMK